MSNEKLEKILLEVKASYEVLNKTWSDGHVPYDGSVNDFFPYVCRTIGSLGTGLGRSTEETTIEFRKSMIKLAALCLEAVQWCDKKLSGDS